MSVSVTKHKNLVGGEWVEPRSGEYAPSAAPRDEEVLAEVAYAGPEDVDLAVRGKNLVGRIRRQQATQDLKADTKKTVSKAKTGTTQAKKATSTARSSAKSTGTAAKKTATTAKKATARKK